MTTKTKRKVSVSLDADLVEELEANSDALSTQVNEAIRADVERRRRHRRLGEFLDELEARNGPIDEDMVNEYMGLLR